MQKMKPGKSGVSYKNFHGSQIVFGFQSVGCLGCVLSVTGRVQTPPGAIPAI